jgi:hypothetical protein
VEIDALRDAYAAFRAEAEAGGFASPGGEGWTAEQVVAHIVVNDGLLADTTEALLVGHTPSYDNAAAADGEALAQFAADKGGMAGLLTALTASSERLCTAVSRLTDEQAATPVPTLILDSGEPAIDEPLPWGLLMTLQAQRHIPAHADQLRKLR